MAAIRGRDGILFWGLGAVALLLVTLTASLAAVFGTQSGTRWTLQKALAFVPQVTVEQIQGTLWRGVTLEGLRYDDAAGTEADVRRAHLALSWPALLGLRVHVRRAEAAGVRLRLAARETAGEPGAPPDIEALTAKLPLDLQIDALSLREVTLQNGPAADAIRLASLDTALRADRLRVVIPRLSLVLGAPLAAHLEANASLERMSPHRLTMHLDGDLVLDEGRLDWSLASEGVLSRLRTTGRIGWQGKGTPDAAVRLAVETGPVSARIDELSAELLGGTLSLRGDVGWENGVTWQAAMSGRGLQPGPWFALATGPVSFEVTSSGGVTPQGALTHDSRLLHGAAEIDGIALTDMALHVTGDLDAAVIHELSLHALGGLAGAEGRVSWQDGVNWDLRLTGQNLDPGRFAAAAAGRVGFRAATRGRLAGRGRLTHETRLDDLSGVVAGVPFEALGMTVAGDLENIRIHDLAGRVLGARLAGGARLQLGQARIGWDARLSLDNADLAKLKDFDIDTTVSGRLGLDLTSRGQWRGGQAFLTAALENLRGELAGQKISGRIEARLEGRTLQLQPADLTLGANRVQLSGTVTPPFDLQYRLTLPELALLPIPSALELALAGRLEGEGRLRGTLEAPDVDARLSGRGLAFDDLRVAQLDLTAKADRDRLALEVRLKRLAAADLFVETVTATVSGSLPEHDLRLEARTDHGRLKLALHGGLQQRRWQGRLTGLDLLETEVGNWGLDRPAALRMSEQDFSLEEACLVPTPTKGMPPGESAQRLACAEARLCVSASRLEGQPIQAMLDALLPMALARPMLPPALRLPGAVALKAEASIGETIAAEAELRLPDNRIIASGWTEAPLSIDYRDARIGVSLHDQQLNARVGAHLPGYVELDGEIRARLDGERPLSGRIRLKMPDMAWLNAMLPAVSDLTGRADAGIALSGTLTRPELSGRVTVENLTVNVPDTGVAYEQGRLRVDIDAVQQVKLEGRLAGATGGQVRINGQGSLAELPQWRLVLAIDGEDLPVLHTNELVVDASPALTVTADRNAADIRGRIVLPRAEARVQRLPEGAVGESPDLVLAGQEEKTAAGYGLRTDVEIVLGERVSLEGMGFSAGLAGQVRLRGDESAPVAAFGEVDIKRGRYTAFGQDLRIDRGRLTFNGPLDDPGLEVRASRSVDDYQAGLNLSGTLKNPRSQVFSVPTLPESDALSLLLTGRRLSAGTTGADADLLINALAGLGIKKGDDIARDIGQAVGFDELGLESGGGLEGTHLTVGKRLSSRLLVRYAVGVFDGVAKFITEYKINRYLNLEISSSPEAQGGDLIYRIER